MVSSHTCSGCDMSRRNIERGQYAWWCTASSNKHEHSRRMRQYFIWIKAVAKVPPHSGTAKSLFSTTLYFSLGYSGTVRIARYSVRHCYGRRFSKAYRESWKCRKLNFLQDTTSSTTTPPSVPDALVATPAKYGLPASTILSSALPEFTRTTLGSYSTIHVGIVPTLAFKPSVHIEHFLFHRRTAGTAFSNISIGISISISVPTHPVGIVIMVCVIFGCAPTNFNPYGFSFRYTITIVHHTGITRVVSPSLVNLLTLLSLATSMVGPQILQKFIRLTLRG